MKLSLWQLNQSYAALVRLASREIPKEHHKLAYWLAKVVRSAKAEIETLGESLNDLMRKCGFEPGQADVSPEMQEDYNSRAKQFMLESDCEMPGDPIAFDKLVEALPSFVPMDLALLDWLIVEEAPARAE